MAVFYGLQEGRCLRELLQLITATICIRDSKSLDSTFDVILESKCLYARNSVIKKITQYKKNLMRKLYCFVLLEFQEKLPECTYKLKFKKLSEKGTAAQRATDCSVG